MQDTVKSELDRVIRQERGRLIAGLVARFGPGVVDLAEDAVQDALVAALETWSHTGLPDTPGALLTTIARRRLIEKLRRAGRDVTYDEGGDTRSSAPPEAVLRADVADPELRLIALCCHPALSQAERLTLTVKLVGGFSAKEIAGLFLITPAAVGQRVARALRTLRDAAQDAPDGALPGARNVFELRARAPAMLQTIYLLFSVGYAPRLGSRLCLDEVCAEALRLAELTAAQAATRGPDSSALAGLLCLQAARLPARSGPGGELVLLSRQDRATWDRDLIARGAVHLEAAKAAKQLSTIHVEAAIALAHSTAPTWSATPWGDISRLYGVLEDMTGSVVVAVNACIAQAFAGDHDGALARLEHLETTRDLALRFPVSLARAEILSGLGRGDEAQAAFKAALALDLSQPVVDHIERRMAGECGGAFL